jgi:hypothetical protein
MNTIGFIPSISPTANERETALASNLPPSNGFIDARIVMLLLLVVLILSATVFIQAARQA